MPAGAANQSAAEEGGNTVPVPDMAAAEARAMSECMGDFARTFEASARRWEMIVYPSLFAFIILAAYGFYLIYELTTNVTRITAEMNQIVLAMDRVSNTMGTVSHDMHSITRAVNSQIATLDTIAHNAESMNGSLVAMRDSVGNMAATVHQIRYDMTVMNYNMHNVSRPMSLMNSFLPW